MPSVVISPFNVVNFPEGGGHFWVYMQYALGLRQLGCEIYWLEGFRSRGDAAADQALLDQFHARMRPFGLSGNLILYPMTDHGEPRLPLAFGGMRAHEAEEIFQQADLLLNFHYAISPALLTHFRRTALVDIDPGLLQFWISRGQLRVPKHDLYFTTGETVGTAAARFPDCGWEWFHIRPPVCLEHWPSVFDPRAEFFSTVSNWDADDWIVDAQETYENTKRVALLEFAELPRLTPQPLELALYLRTERDDRERRELQKLGWRVRPSREVANTPEAYRAYLQQSRGEFSCAKPSYIRMQTAWISDRTICYLASGKPAVVQHTGPSSFLPDGEGLFRFATLEQAVLALETINVDYAAHSRAARAIAETFFDAKQIMAEILSHALAEAETVKPMSFALSSARRVINRR